ncbi:reverse transcriptase family protein [Flavobacterium soyae]|uniref:reverse transcriptase family protein n=1 Tax=Flavobacterium soyae TaxID=2903098 RepID=UPI001E3F8D79|nr:reverse transcriptase family protein [Flavobacterium soyae]MCD9577044.1 reverse transcriptase family protein [Flavobacterium soyae]
MKHTEIETRQQLANYLRCNIHFLEKAINNEFFIRDTKISEDVIPTISIPPSEITVSKYYIKKKGKNGGFRIVHHIWTYQLENSLKILNNYLNEIFIPFDFIHGFVKGKNIKTNADTHLAKKIILSVDIENYFESISKEMIILGLCKIGFKEEIAESIASIVTINGFLPQGFCTSPTIANIVTHDLDQQLKKICGTNIQYTRYADDLYFSSDIENIPLLEITKIIEIYGFILNENKTKWMKRGQLQYVTGLTTFDSNTSRISKKRKKNIRLEIYYLTKFGFRKHIKNKLIKSGENINAEDFEYKLIDEIDKTRNNLFGWLHFIKSIEPEFSAKYYSRLKKAKR